MDAVNSAGLTWPLLTAELSRDVGTYVLRVPSTYRTLKEDEADRLESARQGAIRNMRRVVRFSAGTGTGEDHTAEENDIEAGARLVLLRGRAPTRIEPSEGFGLDLRAYLKEVHARLACGMRRATRATTLDPREDLRPVVCRADRQRLGLPRALRTLTASGSPRATPGS